MIFEDEKILKRMRARLAGVPIKRYEIRQDRPDVDGELFLEVDLEGGGGEWFAVEIAAAVDTIDDVVRRLEGVVADRGVLFVKGRAFKLGYGCLGERDRAGRAVAAGRVREWFGGRYVGVDRLAGDDVAAMVGKFRAVLGGQA